VPVPAVRQHGGDLQLALVESCYRVMPLATGIDF
jgi:hypothetical protein